jgi:phenylalanyl-tRNA synthetase beta chain
MYISEIDLDALDSIGKPDFRFSSISKFQSVERDIALIMDENISISDLLSCIKNLKLNVLKNATLFDVYHGGRVPEGKKSVALNLYFLNEMGSFKSEEINELEERILMALEDRFSAVRISK